MRKIATGCVVLVLCAALTFLGGCSSGEGFDPGDISITGSTSTLNGTNLAWSMTLTSISADRANLDLQIKLRTPGSSIYFYTSPIHAETLGGNETKTFVYAETGVTVPPGVTTYEYLISFAALPD